VTLMKGIFIYIITAWFQHIRITFSLLGKKNKTEWLILNMESAVITFLTISGLVILIYAIDKQAQFFPVHNTKSVHLCGEKSQVPCGNKFSIGKNDSKL